MKRLITAKEAKEKTENYNYINGNQNLISAMESIKKSYSIGINKCEVDFFGNSKKIDEDIEIIKKIGYTILNMSESNTDDDYEVRSFTILW